MLCTTSNFGKTQNHPYYARKIALFSHILTGWKWNSVWIRDDQRKCSSPVEIWDLEYQLLLPFLKSFCVWSITWGELLLLTWRTLLKILSGSYELMGEFKNFEHGSLSDMFGWLDKHVAKVVTDKSGHLAAVCYYFGELAKDFTNGSLTCTCPHTRASALLKHYYTNQ